MVGNPARRRKLHVRVLAIETSTDACSVALTDGVVQREDHRIVPRGHNREVLAMIDGLCAALDIVPRSLDAVAVGAGPGSFTGLRIGASVAQGIALASGCRVLGVSSLEVLAATLFADDASARTAVCAQPARPGELHVAVYGVATEGISYIAQTRLAPLDEVVAWLSGAAFASPVVLVGGGAEALAARLSASGWQVRLDFRPRAASLLGLALPRLAKGEGGDAADLVLDYGTGTSAWRKAR